MKNNETEFTQISVGIDLHKNSWDIQPLAPFGVQKRIHLSPPCVDRLETFLKKNYPNCEYLCAYEAGFSGFWLQRELERRGIKTIVVHPADIPTTDKEKRFKTDKVDCKK